MIDHWVTIEMVAMMMFGLLLLRELLELADWGLEWLEKKGI